MYAKDYVPGLGREFKVGADEIHLEEVAKQLPASSGNVTKEYVDTALSSKANVGSSYTKSESDAKYAAKTDLSNKLSGVANSTATDIEGLVKDFNNLLAKLKS